MYKEGKVIIPFIVFKALCAFSSMFYILPTTLRTICFYLSKTHFFIWRKREKKRLREAKVASHAVHFHIQSQNFPHLQERHKPTYPIIIFLIHTLLHSPHQTQYKPAEHVNYFKLNQQQGPQKNISIQTKPIKPNPLGV